MDPVLSTNWSTPSRRTRLGERRDRLRREQQGESLGELGPHAYDQPLQFRRKGEHAHGGAGQAGQVAKRSSFRPSLQDALDRDALTCIVERCDLSTLQALRCVSIVFWHLTRSAGCRQLCIATWEVGDADERGFVWNDQFTLTYPFGAICILSSQRLVAPMQRRLRSAGQDKRQRREQAPCTPAVVARFRVSGNPCWGVGLVPSPTFYSHVTARPVEGGTSDDPPTFWRSNFDKQDVLRSYWQCQGKNGWCSSALAHTNKLPELDMHNCDIEISVDVARGEITLSIDGSEPVRQELKEMLPACLAINGNNQTEVTFLTPTIEAIEAIGRCPLPAPSQRFGDHARG